MIGNSSFGIGDLFELFLFSDSQSIDRRVELALGLGSRSGCGFGLIAHGLKRGKSLLFFFSFLLRLGFQLTARFFERLTFGVVFSFLFCGLNFGATALQLRFSFP